jgi:cytochrome c biogenesis protein CcdA
MTSASNENRLGPVFLALGLSTAFALAGGVFTFILLNLGLDPEALRWVSASLMLLLGFVLVINRLADWVAFKLSLLSSKLQWLQGDNQSKRAGQFGVGFLLGFVWLPCVGPTLGTAIALASLGQNFGMSFLVMFAYGIGTALALFLAAITSNTLLTRIGGERFKAIIGLKKVLGYFLIILALLVIFGLDKVLEAFALGVLPDWASSL